MINKNIVFISNYFNHHQQYLSDSICNLNDGNYLFIETSEMTEERKKLGWKVENNKEYVVSNNMFLHNKKFYLNTINKADYVIFGSAPDYIIKNRYKDKKVVFRYSERFYKKGVPLWQIPIRYFKNLVRFKKNEYMLCASAYLPYDLSITHNFKNKMYKWGYFPQCYTYDIEKLFKDKKHDKIKILWVGRLIEWKHPEDAINLAKKLKEDNIDFEMEIIGSGNLYSTIFARILNENLKDKIILKSSMPPVDIRKHMENSNIFIFTSDFNEGWGVVLNEAMNSGCACVVNHAIGSVPYLIKDKFNGFIYKNQDFDTYVDYVKNLCKNKDLCELIGKNAYYTIINEWNAEVAGKRFLEFADDIEKFGNCTRFKSGPCSKAELIKNDWFEEE